MLITYSWHRGRRRCWPRGGAAGCQPYLPNRERGFRGVAHAYLRAEERGVGAAVGTGVDPGDGPAKGAGILRNAPIAAGPVLYLHIRRGVKIEAVDVFSIRTSPPQRRHVDHHGGTAAASRAQIQAAVDRIRVVHPGEREPAARDIANAKVVTLGIGIDPCEHGGPIRAVLYIIGIRRVVRTCKNIRVSANR